MKRVFDEIMLIGILILYTPTKVMEMGIKNWIKGLYQFYIFRWYGGTNDEFLELSKEFTKER